MNKIKIGYELETGKEITINPAHLVVTGLTQLSGKTTTLEALINRSGTKAIVFKTKIGEKGFTTGTIIPAFFKERSDWEYVASLLEATMKEKMRFERSWIIEVTKGTNSLFEVKQNIDDKLSSGKLRALDKSIYTTLQAYFEKILPQLQFAKISKTLTLNEGINIMNLEAFSDEVQSLIIRSVLEKVLREEKKVVIVIPEAWKFLPQGRGNPCKEACISLVRQGATNQNFVWIDSQDITGVEKTVLKQTSTWIMGYQSEINEVKRTLDQIPVAKKSKPKPEDIMTLKVGQFIVCTNEFVKKVYVQPSWVSDEVAKKISMDQYNTEDIKKPKELVPYNIQPPTGKEMNPIVNKSISKGELRQIKEDLTELRMDFFNKLQEVQTQFIPLKEALFKIQQSKPVEPDINEIVSLVLQKVQIPDTKDTPINTDEIINSVLARIPKVSGIVSYEVAPLEKLKKDFLEESKSYVLSKISQLDDEQKKLLKFIESQGKGCNLSVLIDQCLKQSASSGGTRGKVSKKTNEMNSLGVIKKDRRGVCSPGLKDLIGYYLQLHGASEQEIDQVYNHILMELLS